MVQSSLLLLAMLNYLNNDHNTLDEQSTNHHISLKVKQTQSFTKSPTVQKCLGQHQY